MSGDADGRAGILDGVIELLESEGHDAVQLHAVAKRARVSFSTIYRLFPGSGALRTRDELIVSAIERWMDAHSYAELTMPAPDESPRDVMLRVLRTVFEPWERHPGMLRAFHRARRGPGGERLAAQAFGVVEPVASMMLEELEELEGADPDYAHDVRLILGNVVYGLISRFTDGHISITEIRPSAERAIVRLTADPSVPLEKPAGASRGSAS